ncbi:MAG: 4-hydroxybenzoyl-CoA reductase subunit beta [Rhodospirillales bacterium]|jgi:4-hydroxybenzoyl-CoA reductase subunit beta|nr:4-hydroxybenzoyl-CoA reductase subunit beta [Rhodospirillales bacterium]MDP6773686.1 4-hydroxybenzoyl-CoA reductase subunit beta [Rhodospirillales bacterium]
MEYMPEFRLCAPASVDEAVGLAAADAGARYLSGGTDLVVNVRRGIERPAALIDLSAIGELKDIDEDDGGLRLGAGVVLRDLAENETLRRDFAAVAEAALAVAGPTHREYATLGGNLCLDTRCLFYNQSEWWRGANDYCLKKEGETCHVAPKGSFCFAAFSGDVAPALLVSGAEVELAGPEGRRRIPLAELYNDDGMDHLALKAGELVAAVHLPGAVAGVPSAYAKARVRGSIDFPLAGAAVALAMKGGGVEDLRVGLTAVGPRPFLVEDTERFADAPLDGAALDDLREMVRAQAQPMRTTTVAPWYRRRVAGNLARRLAAGLAAASP